MKLLIDTHCWLWLQTAPERLAKAALDAVSDPANEVFLSAASAWEIAIKHSLGKLDLPLPPHVYVPQRLRENGFSPLPIRQEHALRVASLPLHHRDPFDRLLVAQAQTERLTIVTVDPQIRQYAIVVL